MEDAALAARVEVAAHTVADLDRRLGQIDSTIEEAAKRGRTTTALTAIEAARKTRDVRLRHSANVKVRPLQTSKPSASPWSPRDSRSRLTIPLPPPLPTSSPPTLTPTGRLP